MEVIFNIRKKDDFAKVTNDIFNRVLGEENMESTMIIGETEFIAATNAVNNILYQTNCDTIEIKKLLIERDFNAENINIFCSHIDKRKSSLLLTMLLQHNCSFGETLVSFDWLVKFVCGTSELKKCKYPLLQLAITTMNNKQLRSNKSFDITKDMLTKIITVLEDTE